jgi:acyl carrier protein
MTIAEPSPSDVPERFADIVARSLRIPRERVTADAYLSDLGAESLDVLEMLIDIEDEFGVVMPQKDILQVAEEVFGPGVLVHEGVLTEHGVRLLRQRMPELPEDAIASGMPVAEVTRIFARVGTWLRLIDGLLERAATACPSCAGALGKPLAGRRKCGACGTEVDLPAGDDLNRRWVEEYYRSVRGDTPGGEGMHAG